MDTLRLLPGFEEIGADRLAEILAAVSVRQYEPGELIIREGEVDSRVFFLVQGQVRIAKGEAELDRLHRLGDLFGEMGAIDGGPRCASVQAVQRSLCLAVDAAVMRTLRDESRLLFSAVLFRTFAERLAERLREMNDENLRLRELLRAHGLLPA